MLYSVVRPVLYVDVERLHFFYKVLVTNEFEQIQILGEKYWAIYFSLKRQELVQNTNEM